MGSGEVRVEDHLKSKGLADLSLSQQSLGLLVKPTGDFGSREMNSRANLGMRSERDHNLHCLWHPFWRVRPCAEGVIRESNISVLQNEVQKCYLISLNGTPMVQQILGLCPTNVKRCPHKNLYMNVHGSIIHKSQNVERTHISNGLVKCGISIQWNVIW